MSISGYPGATVSNPRPQLTGAVKDEPCTIDSENEAESHMIDYLWEVKSAPGSWTAEFSMTLSDGQVVVRAVTITVN